MLEIQVFLVFFFFKTFFLMWIIFKVFIEFVTVLLLLFFFLSFFFFLVEEHVGSSFPDQGSNLYPLHWKEKSATGLRGRFPY